MIESVRKSHRGSSRRRTSSQTASENSSSTTEMHFLTNVKLLGIDSHHHFKTMRRLERVDAILRDIDL